MDSEKKIHTLGAVFHDSDAIRELEVSRLSNGVTAFTIKTTYPDQSEPIVFRCMLTPRAVELMHTAMAYGMKDTADWPKPQDTTAPAPGKEGGE